MALNRYCIYLALYKIYNGKESKFIYIQYLSLERREYLKRMEYFLYIQSIIYQDLFFL